MKLVFLSNYFNHHQRPFSEYMSIQSDVNYIFISTNMMNESRRLLGYGETDVPEFVMCSYQKKEDYAECQEIIDAADVVIIGSAPEKMLKYRKKTNKLIFRCAERPLKKGLEVKKYPVRFFRWHKQNPINKPIYMLCASAYTSNDYKKFGLFKNCSYKWGYFPAVKKYCDIDSLISEKSKTTILWCGRFLNWKHPDDAILLAKCLKENNYNFKLEFIGCGEMESELLKMVDDYDLGSYVHFHGAMSPECVRLHMEKSGIYLFTSDKQEGWGAVLNESMNSGCAVVANRDIGAVPFLIENDENGLIYESGDIEMLYQKVKYLLDNTQKQDSLGKKAYETIINEWNAEVAGERLLNLVKHILDGEKYPELYESGPCSKA